MATISSKFDLGILFRSRHVIFSLLCDAFTIANKNFYATRSIIYLFFLATLYVGTNFTKLFTTEPRRSGELNYVHFNTSIYTYPRWVFFAH